MAPEVLLDPGMVICWVGYEHGVYLVPLDSSRVIA